MLFFKKKNDRASFKKDNSELKSTDASPKISLLELGRSAHIRCNAEYYACMIRCIIETSRALGCKLVRNGPVHERARVVTGFAESAEDVRFLSVLVYRFFCCRENYLCPKKSSIQIIEDFERFRDNGYEEMLLVHILSSMRKDGCFIITTKDTNILVEDQIGLIKREWSELSCADERTSLEVRLEDDPWQEALSSSISMARSRMKNQNIYTIQDFPE